MYASFEPGSTFPREAHGKKRKTVAGDLVTREFAACAIGVITGLKIQLSEFNRALKRLDF